MSRSEETLKNIIRQIENDYEDQKDVKKTIDEVINIFLKDNNAMQEDAHWESADTEFHFDMKELTHWKRQVNQNYSIQYNREIICYRKHFRRLIIFIKRMIRKMCRSLIQPLVEEQNEFNANVTAAINALYNNEIVTEAFILKANNHIKNDLSNKEEADVYAQIDYFDFENHFRGSREEIKEALSGYMPYFSQKDYVVDLGCGRGEFLELLKENGISGIGVDNYPDFVKYCKEKNLEVVCEDAIQFLADTERNSIPAIFAAQLVEHLPNEKLLELCHLAYEKLELGGCLILETPNPMCLSIYTNAFYVDPSHNKPVHPKTLEYLLKREGFCEVNILFTEASKIGYRLPLMISEAVDNLAEINDGINLLSDLFFGSQDYAVIAKK